MLARRLISMIAVALQVGCSSLTIQEPKDNIFIVSGVSTPVIAVARPQFTSSKVTINGNDVTQQMQQVSPQQIQGNFSLADGNHGILVEAVVPCWYCSGSSTRIEFSRQVCVVPQTPQTGPFKSAYSVGSGQSWGPGSPDLPRLITNGVAQQTRWNFRRLAGAFSSTGLIESSDAPCRCLRSTALAQGVLIILAMCNESDPMQQWQSLSIPASGSSQFRFQNNGFGTSEACLTEGPAPGRVLVRSSCNDAPNQLWTIRDGPTNAILNSPW